MGHTIKAHFDGTNIVPDEPLDLPEGRKLRVHIELEAEKPTRHAELSRFAGLIDDPDLPSDLSEQHDHYLYGTPKK